MKKVIRTVCYDEELHIEAYHFEGIVQPFPNHFHDYYVIGFIEAGTRCLSCKNKDYMVTSGDMLLFNPNDNHSCIQCDGGTLDYRGLNISKETCPKQLKWNGRKKELTFAAAGLTGICLYYLLENVALICTMASNVGVIISIAPFFTAILSNVFLRKTEKPQINFYIGFVIAMLGICLINFNGMKMHLNPLGDLLSVAAAVVWACYSVLSKKISSFGFHTILTTRRVFAYGILFMIPFLYFGDFHIGIERFKNPVYLGNMLFLGIGASALCFVTWNIAVRVLGAIKTSIYIYLVPVITMVASVLIINEKITFMSAVGAVFTLSGLIFSNLPQITERKRY